MLRAVIADDSGVMRELLTKILESGNVDVVARAEDGHEAVESILTHEPDVATVDIEMPGLDGIEVIERVMETNPTPILVVSALTERGADATFDALEAGAIDFFTKPSGHLSVDIWSKRDEILEKLEVVAKADLTAADRGESPAESGADGDASQAATGPTVDEAFPNDPTLVVGASTGGPRVVERVLAELPIEGGLRILVVQHMADHYTSRFATRLNRRTEYEIREASDGDTVGPGEARLAKGGTHLAVTRCRNGTLTVTNDTGPQRHNVRPAIDVTMETVAETVTGNLVGVILTGMGADGAAGISAIKAAGGKTIVQDEETSRIFGMPEKAIETGDVDMVLPEDRIAEGITNAFEGWSA